MTRVTEAAHGVFLHGRNVGSILQRDDVARFVFSERYWSSSDRDVLGLWFEDNPNTSPQAALRLPPWFSNLLPEGPFRDWIAHERGVNVQRELQLLLHIGSDLPGAVQVVSHAGDHEALETLHEGGVGDAGLLMREDRWKFSLAGVGMKFSMLRDGDRLTLPGRNATGDWIVKLPSRNLPQVPANEFAMMDLAQRVGIDVPPRELVHRDQVQELPNSVWANGEHTAYAIERFDRKSNGQRVHIEDLAQVRGWYPGAKYDGSFATAASLMYRNLDEQSLKEFVRRLVFNILIGNGDAHLKNWSLIYPDGRKPRISPAYDIVCTGAYYSDDAPDDLGLKLNGDKRFDRVSRGAFIRLEEQLRVKRGFVIDVLDATVEQFRSEWREGPVADIPQFVSLWLGKHQDKMASQLSRSQAAI
jgi:serine/threonine-protein kinase HipA